MNTQRSSRGIGAEIARELSRRGARIVLNYPYPSLAEECNAVGLTLQTEWIAICADLSTEHGPAELVQQAVARFTHIDILVNNAGWVPLAPLAESTTEIWSGAMDLNARGAFLLTKAVLPHLPPHVPPDLPTSPSPSGAPDGSRIIIVGSSASRQAREGQSVYAATKGALESMMRVWARELPPRHGCTVNMVAPGPVLTEAFRDNLGSHFDQVLEVAAKETPVQGGFASTADVAWAVAFFAEERSRFLNGVWLPLSGGRWMH
ncbi:NAD(P)-binding protein [Aspergillus karnatakaensis]|uniref:SDR family NAD(P)-dependent oxidoreductase n=1 Tax=Aspergillus karnatakaensis TaxID=1810916 RepID=UPI003CCE0E83